MNDMRMIRTCDYMRRLRPWMLEIEFQRYRTFIAERLAMPFDGATIVLTHHAPSGRSLIGGRCTEPLDASYASNLEPLIPGAPRHARCVRDPRRSRLGRS